MDKEYKLGSLVTMKKEHPCGTNEWEIVRLGADIKIKCINDYSLIGSQFNVSAKVGNDSKLIVVEVASL